MWTAAAATAMTSKAVRSAAPDRDDAELTRLGPGQQIADQLPVAVLEDVQRHQQARVENRAQREQRQQLAHAATLFAAVSFAREQPLPLGEDKLPLGQPPEGTRQHPLAAPAIAGRTASAASVLGLVSREDVRDQRRDAHLVTIGGRKGDELLPGIVGDLEHDMPQFELAQRGMAQQLGSRTQRGDLVPRPPRARLRAGCPQPPGQLGEAGFARVPGPRGGGRRRDHAADGAALVRLRAVRWTTRYFGTGMICQRAGVQVYSRPSGVWPPRCLTGTAAGYIC